MAYKRPLDKHVLRLLREEQPVERLRQLLLEKTMELEDGCWVWLGGHMDGYGIVSWSDRRFIHVLAYETFVSSVPSGLVLDHLCMNKWCWRPDHLEPVTSEENYRRYERWREFSGLLVLGHLRKRINGGFAVE